VLNVDQIKSIAKQKQFTVENLGELGLSLRTDELSVSFMKSGSAVIVGARDEKEAIALYNEILGEKQVIK
jgi:adenylyltransferase/sulfurtransferase